MRSAHSRLAFTALDNLIDRHYIHSMKETTMNELAKYLRERNAATEAWVAEAPLPIDYVACKYQEGWL